MPERKIRLVLPTGRMNAAVLSLLEDSGLCVRASHKDYRPKADNPDFEIKLLKPANIPTLVELGAHDIGFSGLDWVQESDAQVERLLDTELLPVRLVSAAPIGSDPFTIVKGRPLRVASEYERLTRIYMGEKRVDWRYVRSWGATEVFPPEDADLIIDNTATGSALVANRLEVVDEIMRSTTQLIANPSSLRNTDIQQPIDNLVVLLRSVLEARKRVLLEMNVSEECLLQVVDLLPAMKAPTVQPLFGDAEFAVKAAVPRHEVPRLIPLLRRAGATDILQTKIERLIS